MFCCSSVTIFHGIHFYLHIIYCKITHIHLIPIYLTINSIKNSLEPKLRQLKFSQNNFYATLYKNSIRTQNVMYNC